MPFLNNEGLEVVKEIIESKYAGKNADGAVVSVGADYAEYGDWADGNPDGENRKGYFVTIAPNSNDIQIANSASAITGVTTDSAGFIGNYSKGAESDASKGLVGIVGQISVIDNGTCTVGARCMPTDDGTAVPSSNNCGYLVIDRIDSDHVRILVAPTIDMIQRIKTDVSELQDGAPYYTLGLGTEIPAGADLNDYVTPGKYWSNVTSKIGTIANMPDDVHTGFTMTVEEVVNITSGTKYIVQTVTDRGDFIQHKRNYYSERSGVKFEGWVCVSGIDSIVAEYTGEGVHWEKYANGIAKVWAYTEFTYAINYSYAGMYDVSNTVYYPFPFKKITRFDVAAYITGTLADTAIHYVRTNSADFYVKCPNSLSHRTYAVMYEVIGEWK